MGSRVVLRDPRMTDAFDGNGKCELVVLGLSPFSLWWFDDPPGRLRPSSRRQEMTRGGFFLMDG